MVFEVQSSIVVWKYIKLMKKLHSGLSLGPKDVLYWFLDHFHKSKILTFVKFLSWLYAVAYPNNYLTCDIEFSIFQKKNSSFCKAALEKNVSHKLKNLGQKIHQEVVFTTSNQKKINFLDNFAHFLSWKIFSYDF